MKSDTNNALQIYQAHVDALSAAMMDRDFGAFADRIELPHMILQERAEHLIETRDELESYFHGLHQMLKSHGTTDYVRIATEAAFKSDTVIEGNHVTHILQGGKRLVKPYPNRLRLEQINGEWLETVAANAITNAQFDVLMPRIADAPHIPDLPPLDQKENRND